MVSRARWNHAGRRHGRLPTAGSVGLALVLTGLLAGLLLAVSVSTPGPLLAQDRTQDRPQRSTGETRGKASEGDAPLVFADQIEVRPWIYSALAVDRQGRVIVDLAPGDLEVHLAGVPIAVRAVQWQSTAGVAPPEGESETTIAGGTPADGLDDRLVLFFVQSAFESSRTVGHRRTRPRLDELVAALGPTDRTAVISFDSRPRSRLDSSLDRRALRRALDQATLGFGGPVENPPPDPGPRLGEGQRSDGGPTLDDGPGSFFRHLDLPRLHRTFQVEEALEQVGRALGEIESEPWLVFVGWGLGRLSRAGLPSSPALERAVEALVRSRVPVFVLDVTDAESHTLDLGLRTLAERTGGAFHRTHLFPAGAIRQVGRYLTGRHRLVLDGEALARVRERARERARAKERTREEVTGGTGADGGGFLVEPSIRLRRPGRLLALRPIGPGS